MKNLSEWMVVDASCYEANTVTPHFLAFWQNLIFSLLHGVLKNYLPGTFWARASLTPHPPAS